MVNWIYPQKRKLAMLIPVIYYNFTSAKKKYGVDAGDELIIQENGWIQALSVKEKIEEASKALHQKILKDKTLIHIIPQESKRSAQAWLTFCRNELVELKKSTNEELSQKIDQFFKLSEEFVKNNLILWGIMNYDEDRIFNEVKTRLATILSQEEFTLLATPNKLSYAREFERDYFNLLQEKRETGNTSQTKIKATADKHFWIPFDYLGPEIWDEKVLTKKLIEDTTELKLIQKKLKEIEEHKTLETKQKTIIQLKKIAEEEQYLFKIIKTVTLLQDEKKATCSEAQYYLSQTLREIEKRTGIQKEDLYFVTKEELQALLQGSNLKKEIEERKKLSIAWIHDKKIEVYAGDAARAFAKEKGMVLSSERTLEKNINHVEGNIACQGKVIGKAKIVFTTQEISKVETGDILIAPMTTPDYILGMHKAAAFVTDEGGLTSHAAIVAREMQKPCIVGTKIATTVFKDGDIIEVDAFKGIVKRL